MTTSIGKISATLSVSTGKFMAGVQAAALKLEKFQAGAVRVANVLDTIGKSSAVAALGAGAAVAAFTKSQLSQIDALGKTSKALGVTTEALAGLRHHASLVGLSAEDMDSALTDMTEKISDAAANGGDAAEALEALGLSASAMNLLSPDLQLQAIADSMGKLENQGDRVRVAMQLFGDEAGKKMVLALAGGSAAIARSQTEAEQFGLTLNAIDTQKVIQANVAMTKLGAVVSGAGRRLAVELSPYIEAAATKLTTMAAAGGGMGPKVVSAIEWVTTGAAKMADVLDGIKWVWLEIKNVALLSIEKIIEGMHAAAEIGMGIASTLESVLPESVVSMQKSWEATLRTAKADLAAWRLDTESEIESLLVNKSASEKVSEFFADIRRSADAQAAAIAGSTAATKVYNEELLKSLAIKEEADGKPSFLFGKVSGLLDGIRSTAEDQLAAIINTAPTKKLMDVVKGLAVRHELAGMESAAAYTFELDEPDSTQREPGGIPIIRANTAEAQAFIHDARMKKQETFAERQLAKTNRMVKLLEDIKSNTAEDGVYVEF